MGLMVSLRLLSDEITVKRRVVDGATELSGPQGILWPGSLRKGSHT